MQEALLHLRACDPVLRRLIDEVGPYAIEYLDPGFETLVKSIVYQQLSGKVALLIFNRLAAAAGDGRLTPESVLKLRPRKMRALGLSQQKVAYIRDLARRTRSGEVDFGAIQALPDEEVCRVLTGVKGIGVWTAQMFLIFALRRAGVLPSADLGIRAAVRKLYGLPELPKPAQVEELARNWRPYCTVASWYLWRSLEGKAGL
ncbi:MAG: DNA-3-methyladenine glycosylase 2 family protein [Bryobacteraceae bacterium]|jgi:DNA-3-methyladenine glycosylase II